MRVEDRALVERFEAHRSFTDAVLKEALAADLAGDEDRAYGIVWALRENVLADAGWGKQS